MTDTERRACVDKIRALPSAVEDAVRGLSDGELDTPYRPGGWTVRQVVHHLADSHMNAFVRMKLILTEERPTLKPYDQNAWATLVDTTRAPIEPSVLLLRGLHQRWVLLLESVPDSAWGRKAVHPERGEVTIEGQLSTYAGHGEKHVEHILRVRRAHG